MEDTIGKKIIEVSDQLLTVLLNFRERNPNFTFWVRTRDFYKNDEEGENGDRLEKGYWFQGSDYIWVGFYMPGDRKNRTRSFGFVVNFKNATQGANYLEWVYTAAPQEHLNFYEALRKLFPMAEPVSPTKYRFYYKTNDVIKNLSYFLKEQKPQIDKLIHHLELAEEFFITSAKFEEIISRTLAYRERLRAKSKSYNAPGVTNGGESPKMFDVFLLHSGRDEAFAQLIYDLLRRWNLSVYFWRVEMGFGVDWRRIEESYIVNARLVLVTLGSNGWGPHHLELTEVAQKLEKSIIPVVIGDLSRSDQEKAAGLFDQKRYVDLRTINAESSGELLRALQQFGLLLSYSDSKHTFDFSDLIRSVVDGDEQERTNALRQIKDLSYDRTALSGRLRGEIQNYGGTSQSAASQAPRHPDKLTSIRSWLISCLIWTDAESTENKAVLLRHLELSFEPSEHVRYWALAGLYQRNVSYIAEALRVVKEERVLGLVSYLTMAIFAESEGTETDEGTINFFQNILSAANEDEIWKILRVMRIVPMPSLAKAVAAIVLNQQNLAYDGFFALLHPSVGPEAASLFKENLGVLKITKLLITVAASSDPRSFESLILFLGFFDPGEVKSALEVLTSELDTSAAAQRVLAQLSEKKNAGGSLGISKPGYISDEAAVNEDSLNVRDEANTLTAVILAKDVSPPLAIGLFGDWGHGKSFFMNTIKDQVRHIQGSARYRAEIFCKEVVQIEFNAWHYVDTNLWASLVSHILAKLSQHVAPEATFEQNQEIFLAQLDSTREIVEQARAQQNIVKKEIAEKQAELAKQQIERANKKVELNEIRPRDLYDVLTEDERKNIQKVLTRLGIPAVRKSIADLDSTIDEASSISGRFTALLSSLWRSRNWLILVLTIFFVVVAVPVLQILLTKELVITDFVAEVSGFFLQLAGFITGTSLAIKRALTFVNTHLSQLEDVKRKAEDILKEKRKDPGPAELKLEAEISILDAREKETALVLDKHMKRVAELEERIRLLNEERSLNRFLTERNTSEDYRKHLGIISTIRQDFEALTTRLASAHARDQAKFRKVDRIILYIDDLDRCPSAKVIDVLQAVHLLLAYPLFVVIVGVDPRWLLHSLGSSYSAFENSEEKQGEAEWLSTPQNFLEKIFQIQFSLRPMQADGYERLIRSLFSNQKPAVEGGDWPGHKKVDAGESADLRGEDNPTVGAQAQSEGILNNATPTVVLDFPKATESEPKVPSQNDDKMHLKSRTLEIGDERYDVNEDSLIIREWETDFAAHLHHFIPSPRAAKRFSNIYRILKAGVPASDLATFEGSAQLPGNFRVAMLLLAVVTGNSAQAAKLFPILSSNLKSEGTLNEVLNNLATSQRTGEHFSDEFASAMRRLSVPDLKGQLSFWIPRVARYSFDLNRTLQAKSGQRVGAVD